MTTRHRRLSLSPSTIVGYRKDGRPIYPIAGASPEGDTPPADQPVDPPTPTDPPNDPPADPPTEPDPAAEAAKWKALARKHEAQAKANAEAAKRLAEIEAANQTETERAVKEAEQRGRSAAQADFGQRLAAAEVKAALTGIVPDPAAIVEDLNLAKYVTDTGDVDQEAVTALRSKYQALAAKPPVADLKQGVQSSEARNSLDQQIAEATAAGNHALAISLKRQKAYAPTT